jgi:hypothetical protein
MTETYKLPEYEQHPIAIHLMPGGMDDMEFNAFCGDVAQRGFVGGPITLYEGKVLDGWHRYRAAKKTSTAPTFKTYEGNDPAGYVAASNVLRRKLGSLQKALVAARLHRDHGCSQREACSRLSTSNEVLSLVLKAMDSKNTKLIKRIESDAEFTRGMLKEELQDAGLLRAKPQEDEKPKGPNSVFHIAKDGTRTEVPPKDTVEDILGDTDGISEEPEPGTGSELSKNKRKTTRASKTEAQKLSEEYQALGEADKISFLTMIYPTASKLITKHKIAQAVGRVPTQQDSTDAFLAIQAKVDAAKAKKDAKKGNKALTGKELKEIGNAAAKKVKK